MNALAAKEPVIAGGFTRRGACPALSAPMQTGDGLLVRLNPVAGGLSPNALIGLGKSALAHGNGIMEVTARGSLQIRGLTPVSARLLADEVNALGIEVRTGVPVATGSLAGLDPDEVADPTPLAERIRSGIEAAGLGARLGPKVSVVIDGGGRSGLEAVAADVRLTAVGQGSEMVWHLGISGDARNAKILGTGGAGWAFEAAMTLLSAVAELGVTARVRDLTGAQLSEIALKGISSMPIGQEGGGTGNGARGLLGLFPVKDGRFVFGIALPFGSAEAPRMIEFSEHAQALGVSELRLAPKRTVMALCPSRDEAERLREVAKALDFVVSEEDPRAAIAACPGAPACASGYLETRRIATEIARDFKAVPDGTVQLHISGCAKGCAHPGKAGLTLVGSENGAGIVVGGTARDVPLAYTPSDRAGIGLARVLASARSDRFVNTINDLSRHNVDAARLAEASGKA